MSELKACPLCGSKIVRMNGSYADTCFCINTLCPLSNPMKVDKCQSRPLEDALQAKLEVAVDAMQECVDNYSTEAKFVMKLRLETTIAKLEGK